jgi:hypothetical protein
MRIEIFGDKRQALVFDGVIIEIFGFHEGGFRSHVVHVDKLKIKTTRKGARRLEGVLDLSKGFIIELTDETLPLAEQLIAEINRVRVENYGLGPVKD